MAKAAMKSEGVLAPATKRLIELASSKARYARPHIRDAAAKGADKLSDVAVKAAEVLSDSAQKLELAPDAATSATDSAREVLADASEAFARAVRPRKHHLWRWSLLAAGTGAAFWLSPWGKKMRDKVGELMGGDDLDEENYELDPDAPKSMASVRTFMAANEKDELEEPS
jgi:hypothetical protein